MTNWTPKQLEAIQLTEKNILIRAAAGSGKTSVLTQKAVLLLCDKKACLDELLIVTFSNAAAAELKERIGQKLLDSPTDEIKRLKNQIFNADICTLHSFCLKIVRENFLKLDIAPSPYTLSSAEILVMKRRAIEEVFLDMYEKEDEDFLCLVARYGKYKEETFAERLLDISEFLSSVVDDEEWFNETAKRMTDEDTARNLYHEKQSTEAGKIEYAAKLFSYTNRLCDKNGYEKMADIERENEENVKKLYKRFLDQGASGFLELKDGMMFPKKASYKDMDEALADYIRNIRSTVTSLFKEAGTLIAQDEFIKEYLIEGEHLSKDTYRFKKVYLAFKQKYSQLKKKQNAIDYSDMEHLALKALMDEEITLRYSDKYKYVFVDEYQDTSPIQEAIITAVSKNSKLFCVGDLKQSIFSFRRAETEIFKRKEKAYKADNNSLIISMNDNFRSTDEILKFVNLLFGEIMSERIGNIVYDDDEKLKNGSGNVGGKVSITLSDLDRVQERGLDAEEAEFEAIAQKVESLLGEKIYDPNLLKERPIKPGDIAILLREQSSSGPKIKKAIAKRNIPVSTEADANFDDMPEAEAFINILRIIDNFDLDIPLLSAMTCDVFSFTADELADIRISEKQNVPFYRAVANYADNNSDELSEKIRNFMKAIKELNLISRHMPLNEFLHEVNRRTNFLTLLCGLKDGIDKGAFLSNFIENATLTGKYAVNNLNEFLRHIDEMRNKNKIFELTAKPMQSDCVNVMTIHKSKGLEFPIVILPRVQKQLNDQDRRKDPLVSRRFGLAPAFVDENRLVKRNSIYKDFAVNDILSRMLSEEVRVLYVALTRAKQQLHIMAAVKDLDKAILKWTCPQNDEAKSRVRNYLDFIMPRVLKATLNSDLDDVIQKNLPFLNIEKDDEDANIEVKLLSVTKAITTNDRISRLDEFKAALGEKKLKELDFAYKYSISTTIPTKCAVSKMNSEDKEKVFISISDEQSDIAAKRGTALHYAMRYIDFFETDVSRAILKMVNSQKITEAQAKMIDVSLIERFLASDIAKRAAKAKKVFKEQPFCLEVSARELGFDSDEGVIIQGIIDLCFLEDGEWVIVDYKSNRVSKENIDMVSSNYKTQLNIYARALFNITGTNVKQKILYFLRYGEHEI